jgi:hypothetical protein
MIHTFKPVPSSHTYSIFSSVCFGLEVLLVLAYTAESVWASYHLSCYPIICHAILMLYPNLCSSILFHIECRLFSVLS